MKSLIGMGGAMRWPWPKSQPMICMACRSATVSMPSATAALPKRCARSIAVWQIAALVASMAQPLTKLQLSLSSAKDSSRRLENEEKR